MLVLVSESCSTCMAMNMAVVNPVPDSNTSTPKPCKTRRTHPICHWHTKVSGADAFQHLCNTPSRVVPSTQHTCGSFVAFITSLHMHWHIMILRVDGKEEHVCARARGSKVVARPRVWPVLRRHTLWQHLAAGSDAAQSPQTRLGVARLSANAKHTYDLRP